MREILFRGKRVDNSEWVYGYLRQTTLVGAETRLALVIDIPAEKVFDGSWFEIIPETVGQYTGLTDKNGTKIFEGDILVDEGDKVVSVVEFRNGMFCLVDYEIIDAAGDFDEYDCQPMDNYYIDEMKIDGNIHDNPELLKGDNNGIHD